MDWRNKPKSFWAERLTPEQFRIMREGSTERAFTGALLNNKDTGQYLCGSCETVLFDSKTKYDSGSGWPSFYKAGTEDHNDPVEYKKDDSLFESRVEILCKNCGAHLGHVFADGPKPTGQRYCVNSLSLKFKKEDEE